MNTFNKLWGVVTPAEAQAKIDEQRAVLNGKTPENLEEQAISLVGTDIYEKINQRLYRETVGQANYGTSSLYHSPFASTPDL